MGLDETFFFGALAVCSVAFALCRFQQQKWRRGGLWALAVLSLTGLSAYSWVLALAESGKDTDWLGAYRYPAALGIVAVLSLFGLGGLIVSGAHILKK